jgi:addiction module RelE/StbE family toxin
MPEIEWPESFEKQVRKLSPEIKRKLRNKIKLVANDPSHPSLRSKPLRGAPGIYEASIDMNYRLTYERLKGNVLRLRVVAKHDDALRNP